MKWSVAVSVLLMTALVVGGQWTCSYWVSLLARQTAHFGMRGAVEQASDHRFKLYSAGEFFDLRADVDEASPLRLDSLPGEPATAARRLQAALDQFKEARPPGLSAPRIPGERKKRSQRQAAG